MIVGEGEGERGPHAVGSVWNKLRSEKDQVMLKITSDPPPQIAENAWRLGRLDLQELKATLRRERDWTKSEMRRRR